MEYTASFYHRAWSHLASIMLLTCLSMEAMGVHLEQESPSGQSVLNVGVHSSSSHLALLEKLFHSSGYNKLVRPVADEASPVNVTIQLILTDITMVDEMNHQVELNVWMRQVWKDDYLNWNKDDYAGKDKIVVPSKMIWLPDIILYNSVEDPGRKIDKTTHVMIYSDGTIRWSQPATLRFACLMKLTAFPFDQQYCSLRFGSWSFDGSLIDLHVPDEDPWDTKNEFNINGEWQILNASAYRKETVYTIPSNASDFADYEIFVWPEVFFRLKLQRKYNFYLFTLLIPYFLISGLSSLVFFLQPESGEKMSLAITTLLSLVVFNEYVMNIVPPSADFFPLLSKYFLIMIIWVGMCVVLSSWILHIYHQDEDCSRMRPWLRVIIFVFLARAVGMCNQERKNALSFQEACSDDDELDETRAQFSLENGLRRLTNTQPSMDDENTNINIGFPGSYTLEVEVYKIRKYLLGLKEEEKKKEAQKAALMEWRNAAKIVDRFFFWVYSICNICQALYFTLRSLDSSGKNISLDD